MCKFICENWSDIIVAFIGAFFGFGLALILEYWKIRSDKKKESKSLAEEKSKKIEYYTVLLNEVVEKSRMMEKLVKENIEKQSENLLYPIPLKRISMNFFVRLKNIDSRGIFEALAEKFRSDSEWIKKYNNTNSYLDFLEGVFCEELTRINKSTLEKGYNDRLYIKKMIDEIPDILSKEAFTKKEQLDELRFNNAEYVFINEAIKKYRQLADDKSDLDKFDEELLRPILRDITPYEANDYAQDVIFHCKNARVRMTDIKNDVSQTIETYQEIVKSFGKPLNEISEIINLLKNN
jgi:hypothetical protein